MSAPNISDGIQIVKRAITVFFLLDVSESMTGERIAKLNDAIPVTVKVLKGVQDANPHLRIIVKIIEFSTEANLIMENEIQDFNWIDRVAGGYTATATAIKILCDHLDLERMPKRGYPPVCILVSDGYCTESKKEYDDAIKKLNELPWGQKAARIVVSIGHDIDEEALYQFVNKYGSYINCEKAADIIDYIRIVTTYATYSNSEAKAADGTDGVYAPVDQNNVF
jgi:uncharacterized protein YegL